MIKNILYAAFIATILAGCSQEDQFDMPQKEKTQFTGCFEQVNTRVTMDDNYMINWEMEDKLSIFPKYDSNRLYKVIQINGSIASLKEVSTEGHDGNVIEANYAVYPYNSINSISNKVITSQVPSVIEYSGKENSIRHALMTAKSEDNNFTFTNTMGILRLKVNAEQPFAIGKVQSIQLKSMTKGLSGTVTIDYSDNQTAPSADIDTKSNNRTLTINIAENLRSNLVKADSNKNYSEFYIPMVPELFEANDLLLVIQGSSKTYSKYISCEIDIERKKIFTLTHTISALSYDGDIEN